MADAVRADVSVLVVIVANGDEGEVDGAAGIAAWCGGNVANASTHSWTTCTHKHGQSVNQEVGQLIGSLQKSETRVTASASVLKQEPNSYKVLFVHSCKHRT